MLIVLPLLLFVALGLLQAAVYVHARTVAWAAAEEGAHTAAAEGGSLSGGQARARALLVAGLGDTGRRLPVSAGLDGDTVVVDVGGSMAALGFGPNGPLLLPLEVRARALREQFRPAAGP